VIPLSVWDERTRSLFGLSMLAHEPRLRDAITRTASAIGVGEAALLARLDAGDRRAEGLFADALTIGETYFFRDPDQIDLYRRVLLPDALARRPDRPVVVCSAGSASGEEAYTLAIAGGSK